MSPAEEPWYLWRECYEQAVVDRERTAAPPLLGVIDVSDMEQVSVEIGRCMVCGLEKAAWSDRKSGVSLCEGCYEGVKGD